MIKNSIIVWVRYGLYVTLIFAILNHSTFAICDWKDANALVNAHGKIEPEEDNKVAKAHEIFERVRAVASTDTLPTLVVIKSKNKPWAVASSGTVPRGLRGDLSARHSARNRSSSGICTGT